MCGLSDEPRLFRICGELWALEEAATILAVGAAATFGGMMIHATRAVVRVGHQSTPPCGKHG